MTTTKTRLLLFDIDGTLITSGGAGVEALKLALIERFGISDNLSDIEIAGMTDSGIVVAILNKHRIPTTNENVTAFLDSYVRFLALELPQRKGSLLPGVLTLLQKLKMRPQTRPADRQSRPRRSIETGALRGLEFFRVGAFADDHQDRNELGTFAKRRASEKHGREFLATEIDVIGDTPRDILCGKAFGARTVAIATGSWPREKLAEHQPDFLFDDLSNIEHVIATLGW